MGKFRMMNGMTIEFIDIVMNIDMKCDLRERRYGKRLPNLPYPNSTTYRFQ